MLLLASDFFSCYSQTRVSVRSKFVYVLIKMKIVLFGEKSELWVLSMLSNAFKQIKKSEITCEPISELPSNVSTMPPALRYTQILSPLYTDILHEIFSVETWQILFVEFKHVLEGSRGGNSVGGLPVKVFTRRDELFTP